MPSPSNPTACPGTPNYGWNKTTYEHCPGCDPTLRERVDALVAYVAEVEAMATDLESATVADFPAYGRSTVVLGAMSGIAKGLRNIRARHPLAALTAPAVEQGKS